MRSWPYCVQGRGALLAVLLLAAGGAAAFARGAGVLAALLEVRDRCGDHLLVELLGVDAKVPQDPVGHALGLQQERKEDVLGAHVVLAELVGLGLAGHLQHAFGARGVAKGLGEVKVSHADQVLDLRTDLFAYVTPSCESRVLTDDFSLIVPRRMCSVPT